MYTSAHKADNSIRIPKHHNKKAGVRGERSDRKAVDTTVQKGGVTGRVMYTLISFKSVSRISGRKEASMCERTM